MSITFYFRHGFGFDIEYNNVNCHRVDNFDEAGRLVKKDQIICYEGIIIKIPFISICIGDFYPIEESIS
jgi:hypothetical protein